MTLREKLIIKLIAYLIKFIGKGTEGFYSWEFESIIKDIDEKEQTDDVKFKSKMKESEKYLDHIHNLTSEAENKIKESINADKK